MRNRRQRRWGKCHGQRQSARQRRQLIVVIALALDGCGDRTSPQAIYDGIQPLRRSGSYGQALKQAERGLSLSAHDRNSRWYWSFYLEKAEIVLRTDGAKPALKLLDNASIPDRTDLQELRAQKERDRAAARFTLSDYEGARTLLAGAAQMAASAHSIGLHANIEGWRANVFARLRDWTSAETAANEATLLASQTHEDWRKGEALATLGFVLMHQARFEEALAHFDKQLPLIRSDDRRAVAVAKNNIGWCHYGLGEIDKALQDFQRALAIDIEIGDVNEQQACLGNIGNVYFDRGDLAAARKYYLEAVKLNRGDRFYIARWLDNLSQIAIQSKDWRAAEQYDQRAREIQRDIKDRSGEMHSLTNAAFIAQGKHEIDTAEVLFKQVIEAQSEDPVPTLDSEAGLAKLYASTGRWAQAETRFQATLALVDQTRARLVKDEYKLSYLASLMKFSQDYVDFLITSGKRGRALELAESSRARILSERLGIDRAGRHFNSAQYQKLARSTHSVLLSYWIAPQRSFVWAITGNDIAVFTLPPQAKIASLVEAHRALIENLHDPIEFDDPSGRELYLALVAPLRDRIPPGSRIAIVPDGPLYALNFETLPVPDPAKHYLIEDAVVSIAPSLNLIGARADRYRIPSSLLLIGDPETADALYPKLPFASLEIDAVRRHFNTSRILEFRSAKAVPAAYRKSAVRPFSCVHFTAHATSNRENPLDSAIILSASPEGYKLTANSVLQQRLDAGLVTLSACHTAGARTYAGEGLVGFTWAFLQAGAHNVIAGLWDVSDESTPKLMDQLYTGLTRGDDPAQALQTAKLALLHGTKPYSLPYYWAPFQLYLGQALACPGQCN